jgi:hypothetical protein
MLIVVKLSTVIPDVVVLSAVVLSVVTPKIDVRQAGSALFSKRSILAPAFSVNKFIIITYVLTKFNLNIQRTHNTSFSS